MKAACAPGMKEVMLTTDILVGKGRIRASAWLQMHDFLASIMAGIIGHVSPEAYLGGPIAIVKTGTIFVDIEKGGG